MNKLLMREKYIAIHGQTSRFRMIKWAVILVILSGIYYWKGWMGVRLFILGGAVLGVGLHFFMRWMTFGWTRPWGPMKEVIKTPFD